MNNKNKGFTLIELMIVIVIMGLLVVIGIFAFISSKQKGNDSRRKADLTNIAKALEMYYNDNGTYPTESSGKISMTACGSAPPVCDWGEKFGNTSVTYMIRLPKDPASTTQQYSYQLTTGGYRLYAKLDNLQDADIPTGGQKYYDRSCAITGTVYCNYVMTSPNIVMPTPKP
jgi:type II secretion system protein G